MMKPTFRNFCMTTVLSGAVLVVAAANALAADIKVTLSGDQEVPAVKTSATGSGTISVGDDKSVKGSVRTTGVVGTMAHIHEAAPGKNGPVAIPLMKAADNQWSVPAGAKFSDAQYENYKAGNMYVNVHSDAHPDGEIRGQLKP